MKNGKYFPNNWREYKDAPDEMFLPHSFEEIMDWKVRGWILHPQYCAVIRVYDLERKDVKEYAYKRISSLEKRCQLIKDSNRPSEILVATHDTVDLYYTHPPKDLD